MRNMLLALSFACLICSCTDKYNSEESKSPIYLMEEFAINGPDFKNLNLTKELSMTVPYAEHYTPGASSVKMSITEVRMIDAFFHLKGDGTNRLDFIDAVEFFVEGMGEPYVVSSGLSSTHMVDVGQDYVIDSKYLEDDNINVTINFSRSPQNTTPVPTM